MWTFSNLLPVESGWNYPSVPHKNITKWLFSDLPPLWSTFSLVTHVHGYQSYTSTSHFWAVLAACVWDSRYEAAWHFIRATLVPFLHICSPQASAAAATTGRGLTHVKFTLPTQYLLNQEYLLTASLPFYKTDQFLCIIKAVWTKFNLLRLCVLLYIFGLLHLVLHFDKLRPVVLISWHFFVQLMKSQCSQQYKNKMLAISAETFYNWDLGKNLIRVFMLSNICWTSPFIFDFYDFRMFIHQMDISSLEYGGRKMYRVSKR